MNELKSIYYTPSRSGSYAGIQALYEEARKKNPKIRLDQVRDWLHAQDTYTQHKAILRKFPRTKTKSVGVDLVWHMDLIDYSRLKNYNRKYSYILLAVDALSRRVLTAPLKRKTPSEVLAAFKNMDFKTPPWKIFVDLGKEFMGDFARYCSDRNINLIQVESPDVKAYLAERQIKTIKNKISRYMTHKNTKKWIDVVAGFTKSLNSRKSRATGMVPGDVTIENESELIAKMNPKMPKTKFKYMVGSLVRVAQSRKSLSKGYTASFGKKVFRITEKLENRHPASYRIEDSGTKQPIGGVYYEPELVELK